MYKVPSRKAVTRALICGYPLKSEVKSIKMRPDLAKQVASEKRVLIVSDNHLDQYFQFVKDKSHDIARSYIMKPITNVLSG